MFVKEKEEKMKRLLALALAIPALAVGAAACGSGDSEETAAAGGGTAAAEQMTTSSDEAMAAEMNIVDTAVAAGDFTTLVSLVQQAGLAETLSTGGPFTVFAPTDEAFAAVPKETLAQLEADPELLKRVLTYHVVEGEVTAMQVEDGMTAATLAGPELTFAVTDGEVNVGDATVVQPDVVASNGVIHAIDRVLLPPA
jgi:uncharacterized surface protein with fasciclin (FAS1) repeats